MAGTEALPQAACPCARRRAILALLLGLSAGRALGAPVASGLPPAGPAAAPAWLLQLRGDAGARLGSAYLRDHPAERSLAALFAQIDASLGAADATGDAAAGQGPDALGRLHEAVRADYRHGEVVAVDRWLLSRTEARVYAAWALATAAV
jgi:hypothetical protein